MKRNTAQHPKFARLTNELDLAAYSTAGLLELTWHFVARFAPAGDIGRFTDEDIATAVGWTGEPGRLIDAMCTAGWLDRHEEHRLVVHDWPDHCDDGVHLALARAGSYFATGERPKMTRMAKAERERCERQYADAASTANAPNAHGEHPTHGERTECTLPRPSMPIPPPPEPSHLPSTAKKNGQERAGAPDGGYEGKENGDSAIVGRLTRAGVDLSEARKIAGAVDLARIEEVLLYVAEKNDVTNPGGFIRELCMKKTPAYQMTEAGQFNKQMESVRANRRPGSSSSISGEIQRCAATAEHPP